MDSFENQLLRSLDMAPARPYEGEWKPHVKLPEPPKDEATEWEFTFERDRDGLIQKIRAKRVK